MTDVRALGAATVVPMLDLAVKPEQDNLVAPNDVTLAQALFEGGSEVFGIYDDDTPVGLLAIIDCANPEASLDEGDPEDAIYVWRLMIDAKHQRQGHGRAALAFAARLARDRGRRQVVLSVVPSDASAMPFYAAAGFAKTGRIIDGEVEMAKPVP